MEITWYGHASFLIITDQGITIIMDPYKPGGGIMYGPIPDKADIVTVSHDHSDHNYVAGVRDKPQVIKGAGIHKAQGITFKGLSSYHDPSQGSQRGENTIFTFNAGSINVCHLGDLGHILTEREINALGQIGVLLIPVGGFYTIDPREATTVVDQLKPKLTIPMHFKTEKCTFPIEPVDLFLKGKHWVKQVDGSSISLTKENLEAEVGIVVLKPAL